MLAMALEAGNPCRRVSRRVKSPWLAGVEVRPKAASLCRLFYGVGVSAEILQHLELEACITHS